MEVTSPADLYFDSRTHSLYRMQNGNDKKGKKRKMFH